MFPVSDDNSQRRTLPVVTYALIALNVEVHRYCDPDRRCSLRSAARRDRGQPRLPHQIISSEATISCWSIPAREKSLRSSSALPSPRLRLIERSSRRSPQRPP